MKNVEERDYIDQNREVGPLRKAEDAILLDNSHMTIAEQKQWLAEQFQKQPMVNVEIDEGSGFCFGVTTAIKKQKRNWQRAPRSIAWETLCTTDKNANV